MPAKMPKSAAGVGKTPPDVQTYTLRLVMLANNTDDNWENKTKFVAIRISHTDLCGAVEKFMSFLLAEGSGPLAQARRKAAFMRLQISEPIALRVSAVLEAAMSSRWRRCGRRLGRGCWSHGVDLLE
jgi:hypothetical protein